MSTLPIPGRQKGRGVSAKKSQQWDEGTSPTNYHDYGKLEGHYPQTTDKRRQSKNQVNQYTYPMNLISSENPHIVT